MWRKKKVDGRCLTIQGCMKNSGWKKNASPFFPPRLLYIARCMDCKGKWGWGKRSLNALLTKVAEFSGPSSWWMKACPRRKGARKEESAESTKAGGRPIQNGFDCSIRVEWISVACYFVNWMPFIYLCFPHKRKTKIKEPEVPKRFFFFCYV